MVLGPAYQLASMRACVDNHQTNYTLLTKPFSCHCISSYINSKNRFSKNFETFLENIFIFKLHQTFSFLGIYHARKITIRELARKMDTTSTSPRRMGRAYSSSS